MGIKNGVEWSRTLGDGTGGIALAQGGALKAGSAGNLGMKGCLEGLGRGKIGPACGGL